MDGKPSTAGTVMVVDDTPAALRLMKEMLSAEGYHVVTANGGELALDSLARVRPELILLDIRMPGVDGFEVCRRLKALPENREIPVIFISAISEIREKMEGFALGAVDFISKPFQREELLARVRTHLELRRLRTGLEGVVYERTLALEKSNRAYRALSACNRLLTLADGEERLLAEACRIIQEVCGYRMVWVGLPEESPGKPVRPVAQAGFDAGYLECLHVTWADDAYGRGPTGTAIRSGRPAVNRDSMESPDFAPWREQAARRNYKSSAAFPLMIEGQCLGALMVYADRVDAFSEEEIRLLNELACNLAYGMRLSRMQAERNRADNELRHYRERLEELVAERTSQLEAANREMEEFLYSVSHDLRTPLRAIDGFAGLLEKKSGPHLNDEERRLLNVVRGNAARMSQLIDDILAFSRSGRMNPRMSDVDMGEVVLGVWQDLLPARSGRSLHLDLGPLPCVRGDPLLLRQVWIHLLSNAVKFTRRVETARIEVGGAEEGGEATYFVKDNGVGFDPAYAHKLFGVFQRLHGVDEFEGTGIGLAIVRRLVERHGGRVTAEGKPHEGATIRFTLPAGPRAA